MSTLNDILDKSRLASLAFLVAAIAGAVVVVVRPETLDFNEYLVDLAAFAGGVGVLGVARSMAGKGVSK